MRWNFGIWQFSLNEKDLVRSAFNVRGVFDYDGILDLNFTLLSLFKATMMK